MTTDLEDAARAAVERAAEWLARFARARDGALAPAELALVLLGAACARRLGVGDGGGAERALAALLPGGRPAPEADAWFHSGGAVTSLLCAALLPDGDGGAHAFRRWCAGEWEALAARGRPASPVQARTGAWLAALLAGREPGPAPPLPPPARGAAAHAAETAEVGAVAQAVAALSGFGARPLPPGWAADGALERALRLWTFCAVKERDLDLACPLARSLGYAGLGEAPEYAEAVALVLDCQLPDGRFGSQHLAVHLQERCAGGALDVERMVHLRLTAASAWMLAEHALGGRSPLAGAAPREPAPRPRAEPARPAVPAAVLARGVREAEGRALAWVEDRLELFNPLRHADVRRAEYAVKAAAELALTCSLAGGGERYRRIARYLWDEVFATDALREHLLAKPAQLPAAGLYASLRRCGFEDAAFRARLERLVAGPYLAGAEMGPAVRMDLVHAVQSAGLAWPGEPMEAVYRRTLLAHHPDVLVLTDADAYSFTHTVFFATDFGAARPAFATDADRAYLAAALPRLLGLYMRRGNWDLGGELLMAMRYMEVDDPAAPEAWLHLLAAQREDGSWPGPVAPGERADAAGADDAAPADARWRSFADDYHTTLVGLLAIRTAPPS
ncbi:MAG TPA: hypothetical protein VF746_32180 [Longimicrobium sp.]|jgi:hypothetical protein